MVVVYPHKGSREISNYQPRAALYPWFKVFVAPTPKTNNSWAMTMMMIFLFIINHHYHHHHHHHQVLL